MLWLNFANHFLSNQRLCAWSWINRTFLGMVFWWGIWLWVFGLFLFCFCLARGEKVASAHDFGWQSKGGDHFKMWFSFFSCLLVTILYCSNIVWSKDLSVYFVFFWSLIGNFSFSFVFFLSLIRNFSFSFVFFWSLIGKFLCSWSVLVAQYWMTFFFLGRPHCSFFRGQGWKFSSRVKVYGGLRSWVKRLAERLDMMYVRALVWPAVQG